MGEDSYLWLSLDVNSLYTSIQQVIDIDALQQFLFSYPLSNARPVDFILEATIFCLTHYSFTFNDEYFLQVKGTAMGTNFAPHMPTCDTGNHSTSDRTTSLLLTSSFRVVLSMIL